jgi:metal-responsive CopG/Arc/MetJ family transcriptional regulator
MPEGAKTERVMVLMSEDELKRVDDWSFDQRIRSRGEAIRRLLQIAFQSLDTGEKSNG